MDTYKLILTNGLTKYLTMSTVQGDLPDSDVIQRALDDNLIQDPTEVEAVEFWECYDPNDTVEATITLMGRLRVPRGAKLHCDIDGVPCGFQLPDGSILRPQLVMEREGTDEEYTDLETVELEELGFYEFGDCDEKIITMDEE